MTILNEAQIVLPVCGNDGVDLGEIGDVLFAELIDAFGGCTITQAKGGWRAPSGELMIEQVRQYTVAVENSSHTDAKLRRIAYRFGLLGQQLAMYVRLSNGTVEILSIDLDQQVAA